VEKSDASIVPKKRANKADGSSVASVKEEQTAAERVEGRDAEKRNADLQSTLRTQSRAGASQAQERIREVIHSFLVKHSTQEPDAGIPPVRICAGGGP
jgi:hypothetical protein